AWVLGLIGGGGGYVIVSIVLSYLYDVNINKVATLTSIILATILGLLIPAIASILPIMSALGQNLRESLDTTRGKVKAVKFELERNYEGKVNWPLILIGIGMAIFGFMIYYFFP